MDIFMMAYLPAKERNPAGLRAMIVKLGRAFYNKTGIVPDCAAVRGCTYEGPPPEKLDQLDFVCLSSGLQPGWVAVGLKKFVRVR